MKFESIKNDKGAAAVIVAVILVVLLLFTSFVLDYGTAYTKAGQMQNAVDSAALAAASLLPIELGDSLKQNSARNLAQSYASQNGFTLSSVEFIKDSSNGCYNGVRVIARVDVETFIAKIIGINNISISKKATAKAAPVIAVTNIVPLSITKDDLLEAKQSGNTQHLELKVDTPDGEKGAYGALDLDSSMGGGANDFRNYVANGYPGQLEIGDILPIEAGNMSGPAIQGLNQRYSACTHNQSAGGCSINNYVEGCPRIVITPVVTYTNPHQVVIEGFAAFILEDSQSNSNNSEIIGSFLDDLHVTGTGSLTGSTHDFGVYSIYLVE